MPAPGPTKRKDLMDYANAASMIHTLVTSTNS
jgi:hypothetical protein